MLGSVVWAHYTRVGDLGTAMLVGDLSTAMRPRTMRGRMGASSGHAMRRKPLQVHRLICGLRDLITVIQTLI